MAASEKRTPWWNQDDKEAIRAKKDAYKALIVAKQVCIGLAIPVFGGAKTVQGKKLGKVWSSAGIKQ